ncbi:hypothetical protein [Alkalilimnicola sp. S0819]|nr:hypothetical protein [Alkalilimnicola sp. S0819]
MSPRHDDQFRTPARRRGIVRTVIVLLVIVLAVFLLSVLQRI